ncbi:glycosyltransferase [Cutibacterium sp.]|uniref:glycosyltransferase n=1 Tax=Cutibacterium sp. TaxID=1912221 RepID=UPI0026DBB85D|nr:glycosyltransferase [Cutibacterium sp.]MDO4412638.1 glycosyltransferase [Cutibacterium sp.]
MADRKSTLILLTNSYPLAHGEEFLENEINYLCRSFDHVIIAPVQARQDDDMTRTIPDNARVFRIGSPAPQGLARGLALVKGLRDLPIHGVDWAAARHKPRLVASDALFEARAQDALDKLLALLPQLRLSPDSRVTIYSFWLHITARTATLLAEQLRAQGITVDRVVSRAHGYDLYPSRSPRNHIPERKLLLRSLDEVCPVSNQGTRELQSTWPQFAHKVHTRHLGTPDPCTMATCRREPFTIISCAHLGAVKRMTRMPAILATVRRYGIDARWTHLGDGPEMGALRQEISAHGVKDMVTLLGHVDNAAVTETQRSLNPTVFINLSLSEGLPVSMMEVASLGIPIVATTVGGVSEIVSSANGQLLPAEFTDEQAVEALVRLATVPDDEYRRTCLASRQLWEHQFRDSVVYPAFCREVLHGR